jgi:O-antigen/teichoic acid export membrane protein
MNYKNVLKDSSMSATSSVFAALLSVLQAIVVARLLGPESYGTLHIYRLVLSYTAFTNIGTFWAMLREMSYHKGKGDYETVTVVKNSAFTLNMITSTLACIVAVLFFYNPIGSNAAPVIDVLFVCLIIIAARLYTFAIHYFVASKEFMTRGVLVVLFPFCNILFVFPLGFLYHLKGVLFAMIMAYTAGIMYAIKKGAFQVRLDIARKPALGLIKKGFPISVNGLLALAVSSIDRLMILYFLPTIQLGYYGIGAMIGGVLDTLYRSTFISLFPRITESYGKTNSIQAIRNYVWKPLLILSHLSPLLLGTMIILIKPMVDYILPKYTSAVLPAQLVIASSFFLCLQIGVINFFITLNRVHKVYLLRIATIAFYVASIWIAIDKGWGIEGIAFCSLLSYALLSVLLISSFLGHYSISFFSKLGLIASVYYPFLYMCFVLWITRSVSFSYESVFLAAVLNTLLKLAVFLVLNIPLLVIIQIKTGVLTEIQNAVIQLFESILKKSTSTVQGDNL